MSFESFDDYIKKLVENLNDRINVFKLYRCRLKSKDFSNENFQLQFLAYINFKNLIS